MDIFGYKIAEEAYMNLNSIIGRKVKNQKNTTVITTAINNEYRMADQIIDTASVVKMIQLLASERQHSGLIQKMLDILIKNVGAQKIVFLLGNEARVVVNAIAYLENKTGTIVSGLDIAELEDLVSKFIIYEVLQHKKSITIDNAFVDKQLINDPYTVCYKPKSILCIPVLAKDRLLGILYFESNLMTEVFTQIKIEFLKIIISQVAISLENINMYTQLAEKVKKRTRASKIQKSFLQQLFTTSPDAILLLDNNFCITDSNAAFQQLFQYSLAEVRGQSIEKLLIPVEYRADNIALRTRKSQETIRIESVRKRKNQTLVEVYITVYPMLMEGIQVGLCVMYSDISTRKQTERQLRYLSLHDSLTGLHNRNCFEEEMVRFGEMADSSVGIMVCDVDGLKLINDTLGHEVGDQLIQAAAGVINETFRASDVVARIGGDEFAILIPNAEISTLTDCSTRLQQAILSHNLSAVQYDLSISVGFAIKEQNVKFMDEAFKEADSMMYNNKLAKSVTAEQAIVKKLLELLKKKDFFDKGHVERLQQLVFQFSKKLELSKKVTEDLYLLAQFHDIGKVVLPDLIICNTGMLTKEQFAEVRKHSEIGYRIAKSIPAVKHIAEWIIRHHEWWDGSGYPLGLKGETIPIECRIFAIIEAYEVMRSGRPYCRAVTDTEALRELKRGSGKQFDPQLVCDFVEVLSPQFQ